MQACAKLLCLFLTVVLVGCSGPKVKLDMNASSVLNYDINQQSLPVVVRVYQLADDQRFTKASFNELWKQDAQTLGNHLISQEELVVHPNNKNKIQLTRHDKAKYVALVAVFREPSGDDWRIIAPIKTGLFSKRFSTSIEVKLKESQLQLLV